MSRGLIRQHDLNIIQKLNPKCLQIRLCDQLDFHNPYPLQQPNITLIPTSHLCKEIPAYQVTGYTANQKKSFGDKDLS
jgi:hypothetical protein